MQRRKFLAGIGSLAAGGAAAMGTGAVSSQESARAVDTDVVTDADGTLGIVTSDESLENAQFVTKNDGQLKLQFDGATTDGDWASGASGLNPDTTYHFDNAFQLVNRTSEPLALEFVKSRLNNASAFNFYVSYIGGSIIGSRNSDYTGQITSGNGVNVGVTIRTPDQVVSDWETGTLVIRADDPDDQNVS
jgi:hypothetical protein